MNRRTAAALLRRLAKPSAVAAAVALALGAGLPAGAAPIGCPVNGVVEVTGADEITAADCVNAGTVRIQQGGTLTNNRLFTTTGTLDNRAGGRVVNVDRVVVAPSGQFSNAGTVTGTGTLFNEGSTRNLAGGTIEADGSIENRIGATLTNAGTLTSRLELFNVGRLENEAGGLLVNTSSLFNGAFIAIPGQAALLVNAGTLRNETGAILQNTATVTNAGSLVNDGQLINDVTGVLRVTGSLTGTGLLDNAGRVEVLSGGRIGVAGSSHLAGGVLGNGRWDVVAGSGTATLAIGSAPITTIGAGARVLLSGAGASFDQIAGLAQNEGVLWIADRNMGFTTPFTNTGTLEVLTGGHVDVAGTTQLSAGTLTGGTWRVEGIGGDASLAVGTGPIQTIGAGATVILTGAGARFDQLAGLTRNAGTFELGEAQSRTLTGAFDNAGVIAGSGRLVNQGQLTLGGRLGVADLENAVGAGIVGSAGSALQIVSRAHNAGTISGPIGITIATGASFTNAGTLLSSATVLNEGELRNLASGVVRIARTSSTRDLVSRTSIENAGLFALDGAVVGLLGTVRNLAGGTFDNDGAIVIQPANGVGTLDIQNAGTWRNRGVVRLATSLENTATGVFESDAGSDIVVDSVVNRGRMTLDGRLQVRTDAFDNHGSLDLRGSNIVGPSLRNHAGAHLVVDGRLDTTSLFNDGRLAGVGLIQSEVLVGADGVIAPGNSIGTLTIDTGDGALRLDGTLEIEIDGLLHDVLDVHGPLGVRFGDHAALRFVLLGDPTLDRDLAFLLSELLEGFDADVDVSIAGLGSGYGYRTFVRDDDLYVRFFLDGADGTVPAPGTVPLLALGVGLLAARRRRARGKADV